MDRAASCRRAAREAVADVEPSRLQALIGDRLDRASMVPGVLTLETATAVDPDADVTAVSHRAAGVQLIYEGLRLTRSLAREEPWADAGAEEADLAILAADILVARGFYLLARTDAAGRAVRTVQAFGRDQTAREAPGTDADALDANLERDVLELAVVAGAAAVGARPTAELLAIANDVADAVGTSFPPADECLPEIAPGVVTPESDTGTPVGDGVATDRATSATDP